MAHIHVFANSFIERESFKLNAIVFKNPLRYLMLSLFCLRITIESSDRPAILICKACIQLVLNNHLDF